MESTNNNLEKIQNANSTDHDITKLEYITNRYFNSYDEGINFMKQLKFYDEHINNLIKKHSNIHPECTLECASEKYREIFDKIYDLHKKIKDEIKEEIKGKIKGEIKDEIKDEIKYKFNIT